MMLNWFGIDKLHGFIMHSVMLAVGRISHIITLPFSNVGSYVYGSFIQQTKLRCTK